MLTNKVVEEVAVKIHLHRVQVLGNLIPREVDRSLSLNQLSVCNVEVMRTPIRDLPLWHPTIVPLESTHLLLRRVSWLQVNSSIEVEEACQERALF